MEKRFLINRWLGTEAPPIPIYDEASVSSARERVRDAGRLLKLPETLVETVALIASELTHNHLAHARQGYFAVKAMERDGVKGLEVLAADLGPGLEKRVLTGAGPTRGGLGAGLEAVFRLADEIEIDTRGAEGLRVVAKKFELRTSFPYEAAIAGIPYPGESISGDDALYLQSASGFLGAVCDGLGHGPEAREASNKAIETISRNSHLGLREIIDAINDDLAGIRGCVLAIVRFNAESRVLQCLSAGDVRVHLYHFRDAHFFTSTPFVIGDPDLPSRKLRVEEARVAPGSVLVMFTDGLQSRTTIKGELDLLRRPALVIAQELLEKHSRGTDDAMVLVTRFKT
jgi:anti-sigma regulatory factor (Ser/Thr protein kinase)/serine/threonine protein phosphatase PrpC